MLSDVTDREHSVYAHAILDPDDVLVIEDTQDSPTFRENPYTSQPPAIRFYAGAPVPGPRGHPIGTVCVADPEPRQLSTKQQHTLEDLAEVSSLHVRDRDELQALQASNEELDRFAATVSHELIDPISQVVMCLELVEEQVRIRDADGGSSRRPVRPVALRVDSRAVGPRAGDAPV